MKGGVRCISWMGQKPEGENFFGADEFWEDTSKAQGALWDRNAGKFKSADNL